MCGFFDQVLVHTKGQFARKPFILTDWQRNEIVGPLMGSVEWDPENGRYRRRYRMGWIELARKNGKALDVNEPILTARGFVPMGQLVVGDEVHAPNGSRVRVLAVGPTHTRASFRVTFADGRSVIASDNHEWRVLDARRQPQLLTTVTLAAALRRGTRDDLAFRVDVPAELDRGEIALPLDAYLLGVWLGDGTCARGEITTMDPEIVAAITDAGYTTSYAYRRGRAATYGVPRLGMALRALGVLNNKHVPLVYLTADAKTRLAMLAGLLDTDGGVTRGPNTPRVEFCGTRRLVDDVVFLARSLGFKPGQPRPHNGSWRTTFTAHADSGVFRLARKADQLASFGRRTRADSIMLASVEPVGDRAVRCIQVEGGMFLAGRDLVPTHNSELLAGLALYLLAFDGEEGAEIYGAAKDRDQARIIWDVASRMVQLSPTLNRREGLRVRNHDRRIVDARTGSFYAVLARDALGNLGLNPSAILFDEVIAQPDGRLWEAMRTAAGARTEPLMVAATTAGDDPTSFAASEHATCVKVLDDPDRERHRFIYLRNTPIEADIFDESSWHYANPALGDFLSVQALRDEAAEARNDSTKENAFRQFRLNQWVSQSTRWMSMGLYREVTGDLWPTADWGLKLLQGREVWCGLDLSAKLDLTSFCVFAPPRPGEPGHALWWHWLPEDSLGVLNQSTSQKATQWVRQGFLRLMPGGVIDYDLLTVEIRDILAQFKPREVVYDKWSGEYTRQQLERQLGKRVAIIPNEPTYVGMTVPMRELMALTVEHAWNHHGNPVATFCFDSVEVRRAVDNPDLLKPVKPLRTPNQVRIDAVVTAALAVGAWRTRGQLPEKGRGAVGF